VLLTKHKESIQIYFDALKKYCNSSTKWNLILKEQRE
jgi:hypothetical protein